MAGKRSMKVIFPLGGVWRGGTYAQKTKPFTSPIAINIRSRDPQERRGRGGSRPGLEKYVATDFGTNITGIKSLTYQDGDGDRQHVLAVICDGNLSLINAEVVTASKANLTDESGNKIIDESGNYIIYQSTVSATNPVGDVSAFSMAEKGGMLYIADSSLKKYDPDLGTVSVVASAPTGQPIVCVYQERIVLAGDDHMFYMSAQDDDSDWDFAADMGNAGRAVAGYVGDNGVIGDAITCMIPYRDKFVVFGTTDSLWAVYGNLPTDGRTVCVSENFGIIAPDAATITKDGTLVFLSRRGIFAWKIGSESEPEPFSPHRIPDSLLDVDPTATDVVLKYDHRAKGIHAFLTPSSGDGTHWWIDMEHKGFWEVALQTTQQPYCAAKLNISGDSNILLGCKDGYLRRFSNDAEDDDGEDIQSDITFGPFHVPRMEGADGMVAEMVGAMGADSNDVTWALFVGDSAETVVDLAETCIDGDRSTGVDDTGTWNAGQNAVVYPRSRGAWAVLWLSCDSPWAYEAVSMWMKKLGRLR